MSALGTRHQGVRRTYSANVASGDDTGTADEGGTNVGGDVAVQVGHDHDVKLLRLGDELHGAFGSRKSALRFRADKALAPTHVLSTIMLSKAIPELLYSSATALHVLRKRPSPSFIMLALWTQVTFCNSGRRVPFSADNPDSNPTIPATTHLPVVLQRKVERKPRNSIRLGPRADLQVLDDTGETLVLQPGVLALSVFPDNDEIDVLVARRDAREGFADDDRGVDVE